MQVKLALLADYANVTAEGKLNILGIFDRINVVGVPAVHPQMHFILRLEAHPAEWDRTHPLYRPWPMRIGAFLAVLLIAQLAWALMRTPGISDAIGAESAGVSNVGELGRVLFTDYMFAFEVTSILIIAAMVGAVILARKQTE